MNLHRMAAPCAMIAALALGGCATIAQSRLNPANWGGGDAAEETTVLPPVPADPRPLLPEVAALAADPTPGGLILRATARAPAGTGDVALLPVPDAPEGVLAYRLVGWQPPGGATQRIVAAVFIPDAAREGARIAVEARAGTRSLGP
ncbi:MAG: hypothetical protein ACO3U4_11490 [Gemmobacter sp.]